MGKGSGIAVSCGIVHRRGSDFVLLWLWHRLAAVAPIQLLAREPPYTEGVAPNLPPKKMMLKVFSLCVTALGPCMSLSILETPASGEQWVSHNLLGHQQ